MDSNSKPVGPIEKTSPFLARVTSAVFYAISSMAVILINKIVLTSYQFPAFYFLAFSQFLATSLILFILAVFGKVSEELHFAYLLDT